MQLFTLALLRDGVQAHAYWNSDRELVVQAGSQLRVAVSASLTGPQRELREKLVRENIVQEQNGKLLFTQDYAFATASQAGAIICGYSVNGKTIWKDQEGKPLGDFAITA